MFMKGIINNHDNYPKLNNKSLSKKIFVRELSATRKRLLASIEGRFYNSSEEKEIEKFANEYFGSLINIKIKIRQNTSPPNLIPFHKLLLRESILYYCSMMFAGLPVHKTRQLKIPPGLTYIKYNLGPKNFYCSFLKTTFLKIIQWKEYLHKRPPSSIENKYQILFNQILKIERYINDPRDFL